MNNGRPPYGNTPGYTGQQGSAQGGYAPQQPNTGYPQQTGYQPQPGYAQPQQTGYQPQPGYAQPQQTGYQPQPGYAQPQTGYQPQPGYPRQAYPQQPVGYAQPQGQPGPGVPQRQTYQQPYPPTYTQGQQLQSTGYVGYQPPRRRKIPPEQLALMILGGVLPVLFILGMALPGAVALKWVFLVLTVAAIAYTWATGAIKGSLRLTLTMIFGALAVVALVSALTGTPAQDVQNPGLGGGGQTGQQGSGAGEVFGGGADDLVMQPVDPPTEAPTDVPTVVDGAAQEQLSSFLYFWSGNSTSNMVQLTLPSWRRAQTNAETELYRLLSNRIPLDYEITGMTGTAADSSRTATVRATIDHRNGRDPEVYIYSILMSKEDDVWYVDPRTLASNERESATPETGNTTPTQPPLNTWVPGMTLYYNPDGGTKYHIVDNCGSTNAKYLPFKGTFTVEQINTEPYASLSPCSYCGAPLREQ